MIEEVQQVSKKDPRIYLAYMVCGTYKMVYTDDQCACINIMHINVNSLGPGHIQRFTFNVIFVQTEEIVTIRYCLIKLHNNY